MVVAEPPSRFHRYWKPVALVLFLALAAMSAALVVVYVRNEEMPTAPSMLPSMQPSSPPSFVSGSTLESVRSRGFIRCGLSNATIEYAEGSIPESGQGILLELTADLCRAVAFVIFGGSEPDNFLNMTVVTIEDRFQLLNDRKVDLLIRSDTHTIEREVREKTTGSGFAFSSPYYYDGMAYFGSPALVRCAEEPKQYDECSSLRICVRQGTTSHDFVESSFPVDFYKVVGSLKEVDQMMKDEECNVHASDRSVLLREASSEAHCNTNETVGNETKTKEPLSIVTRNDDREFSDVINWVVQALFYGKEQGLTRNISLCQNDTKTQASDMKNSTQASDMNFLNAVYCVGNYGEIYDRSLSSLRQASQASNCTRFDPDEHDRGMNQIKNGTTGMLYATPFGDLQHNLGNIDNFESTLKLDNIRTNGTLSCGLVLPDEASTRQVGLTKGFCRALSAALFNGDPKALIFSNFTEQEDGLVALLNNETVDVLVGGRIEKKYDFGTPQLDAGVQYSTPYYYGNETGSDDVSFFALATREDDVLFSSFVNAVVVATMFAYENDIAVATGMPIVSLFGNNFTWALRDTIYYSRRYHHVHNSSEKDRGRNALNAGRSEMHSFPGLSHSTTVD